MAVIAVQQLPAAAAGALPAATAVAAFVQRRVVGMQFELWQRNFKALASCSCVDDGLKYNAGSRNTFLLMR
jgi:hypothetical protein